MWHVGNNRYENSVDLQQEIQTKYNVQSDLLNSTIRIESNNTVELMTNLLREFNGRIGAVRTSKPTLAEVYIGRTGKEAMWNE